MVKKCKITKVYLLGLDYRIPGHFIYMSLHKKGTIVIYLVVQSTPTCVTEVAGYSIIAPKFIPGRIWARGRVQHCHVFLASFSKTWCPEILITCLVFDTQLNFEIDRTCMHFSGDVFKLKSIIYKRRTLSHNILMYFLWQPIDSCQLEVINAKKHFSSR